MLVVWLLLEEKIENEQEKKNNFTNTYSLNIALQQQLQRRNENSHLEVFLENSFSIGWHNQIYYQSYITKIPKNICEKVRF